MEKNRKGERSSGEQKRDALSIASERESEMTKGMHGVDAGEWE